MCAPTFVCAPVPMEAAEGFGCPELELQLFVSCRA